MSVGGFGGRAAKELRAVKVENHSVLLADDLVGNEVGMVNVLLQPEVFSGREAASRI